jgi:uncharacterized protein (DUF1778 family)
MSEETTTINLRISINDLARIDRASREDNRSRSNFMVNASLEKAKYYGDN